MNNILPTSEVPVLNDEHIETLKLISGDNPKAFIEELVNTFMDGWNKNLETLKSACASKNTEALRKVAHLLSGSSGNIGLKRFSTLCKNVETQVGEDNFDNYDECPEWVEKECTSSINELKTYINNL